MNKVNLNGIQAGIFESRIYDNYYIEKFVEWLKSQESSENCLSIELDTVEIDGHPYFRFQLAFRKAGQFKPFPVGNWHIKDMLGEDIERRITVSLMLNTLSYKDVIDELRKREARSNTMHLIGGALFGVAAAWAARIIVEKF